MGLLEGKVVGKQAEGIIVTVQAITKVWQQSKADASKSLVGKRLLVKARDAAEQAARFVQVVKVGETIELDVGNKEGDTLVILELTQDQRERVEE